ncbi:MAG: peptide-methionine (S)-S-oxide reductase MsrA [Chitinispirillaceae bacterium]
MVDPQKAQDVAVFAGGCFWCLQGPFEKTEGVKRVTAGYTGGHVENPTYEQVTSGRTGHREAVQVVFDPREVSYETLLEIFWRQIDPTDPGGQFADRGEQYKTAVYYHDDDQKKAAEKSKEKLQSSGHFSAPVAADILPAETFYPAEEYHQKYYLKNPGHYRLYKTGSGREAFIQSNWKE